MSCLKIYLSNIESQGFFLGMRPNVFFPFTRSNATEYGLSGCEGLVDEIFFFSIDS